jgi:hypothetical protein
MRPVEQQHLPLSSPESLAYKRNRGGTQRAEKPVEDTHERSRPHDTDVAFIQALAELLRKNDLTELQVKREYGETTA